MKWSFLPYPVGAVPLSWLPFDPVYPWEIDQFEGDLATSIEHFIKQIELRETLTKNFTNAFAGDAIGTRLC